MSSDEESTTCEENDQVKLVELLQNYKVVLEKSQVPTIKKAKDNALIKLQAEWLAAVTGKAISVKQLSKKINSLKTKIKQKADINRTGNKQIKLKPWEQAFWKLMDGDRNPTLCKVPGGVQVGVPPPTQTAASVDISLESDSSVLVPETAKSMAPRKIKKPSLPETAETQNLSTAELQRLVLLEQIEVLRLKKRKLMRELEQEDLLVTENDKVYTQL